MTSSAVSAGEDRGDHDVERVGRVLVLVRSSGPSPGERLGGVECSSDSVLIATSSCRDQVDDGEDHDPDDVDEVPVQADDLDDLGLVARGSCRAT